LPAQSEEKALEKHLRTAGGVDGEQQLPPFFVQFDNIPSLFVEVCAYIDTASIPDVLRPYIELYLAAMFEVRLFFTFFGLGEKGVIFAAND